MWAVHLKPSLLGRSVRHTHTYSIFPEPARPRLCCTMAHRAPCPARQIQLEAHGPQGSSRATKAGTNTTTNSRSLVDVCACPHPLHQALQDRACAEVGCLGTGEHRLLAEVGRNRYAATPVTRELPHHTLLGTSCGSLRSSRKNRRRR